MSACKYWDAGWCYAPDYLKTNAIQGGCFEPEYCPNFRNSAPVQYETPMTENKEEIEKVKAQIKVLEKKLSFLEELEQTKSPAEEAYNEWYGEYPTNTWQGDVNRWDAFQAGYNAAYEEKVSEWKLAPQTPEQVEQGLKEAFREAVKQGVVSSITKPKTLYDLIADWWNEVFANEMDDGSCIDVLVSRIDKWLPEEHCTNSYKWNQCIRMIREKLR